MVAFGLVSFSSYWSIQAAKSRPRKKSWLYNSPSAMSLLYSLMAGRQASGQYQQVYCEQVQVSPQYCPRAGWNCPLCWILSAKLLRDYCRSTAERLCSHFFPEHDDLPSCHMLPF